MSRWSAGARERLEEAAYALVLERGYEKTTVADIARRAGLTERTFFRHYADKREVLFGGSAMMTEELQRTLEGLPPSLGPMASVRAAIEAISRLMHGRRVHASERARIVAGHPDLQERGHIKRAALIETIAVALEARGVPKYAASLAAESGIAVFYVSFDRWTGESSERELIEIVDEMFDEFENVTRR